MSNIYVDYTPPYHNIIYHENRQTKKSPAGNKYQRYAVLVGEIENSDLALDVEETAATSPGPGP